MKKLLFLLVAAMLMVGCGQKNEETEALSTEATTTQAETETETEETETETETESETETEVQVKPNRDEVVIPSYYQTVQSTWQDTYLALLWAVQTRQEEGAAGPPYFALMQMPGAAIPVMICGYMENPVNGYGFYRLYGFEGNCLYELLEFRGSITMDLAGNRFAIEKDGSCYHYIYREQNLVRVEAGGHFNTIPMTMLYDEMVTIDNFESYRLTAAR